MLFVNYALYNTKITRVFVYKHNSLDVKNVTRLYLVEFRVISHQFL